VCVCVAVDEDARRVHYNIIRQDICCSIELPINNPSVYIN